MKNYEIKDYNLNILNVNYIIDNIIQKNIIDLILFYELDKKSINNKDTQKIFYHYFLEIICNEIIKSKNKVVLFYNNTQIDCDELINIYSEQEVLTKFNYIIKRINKLLPIKIFISKYSLKYILNNRKYNYVYQLYRKIINFNLSENDYSLEKIKKFSKKLELNKLYNNLNYNEEFKQILLK